MLVDTSVWIDYFNGIANAHTDLLDSALLDGNVVIGDLIFLEILQGICREKDYQRTRQGLLALDQYAMLGKDLVDPCAENYRTLRRKGITIRKTADVIIATFCMEKGFPLLFRDRDFIPFVEHLGLQAVLIES